MLLKHPILSRNAEALEKVQKLALNFVKGLQLVALQQLRLFSFTHRWIRGDLVVMFKITHGLSEFPIQPVQVDNVHHQICYTRRHQHACPVLE